jgi:hypothetical protein
MESGWKLRSDQSPNSIPETGVSTRRTEKMILAFDIQIEIPITIEAWQQHISDSKWSWRSCMEIAEILQFGSQSFPCNSHPRYRFCPV